VLVADAFCIKLDNDGTNATIGKLWFMSVVGRSLPLAEPIAGLSGNFTVPYRRMACRRSAPGRILPSWSGPVNVQIWHTPDVAHSPTHIPCQPHSGYAVQGAEHWRNPRGSPLRAPRGAGHGRSAAAARSGWG